MAWWMLAPNQQERIGIEECCDKIQRGGYKEAWVDTGYIKKTSRTELTRVIDSFIESTVSETPATSVISEMVLAISKIKPVTFTEPS